MCVLNDRVCAIDFLLNFSRDDIREEEPLALDDWVELGGVGGVVVLIGIFRVEVGRLGDPSEWSGSRGTREARSEGRSGCDVRFESHG